MAGILDFIDQNLGTRLGLLFSNPSGAVQQMNQQAGAYNQASMLATQAERNAMRGLPITPEQAAAKQYVDKITEDLAMGFAGNIKPVGKTPYELAQEVAQKNAVEMLGLPANNTAMDRAKALGYNLPQYHYSRANEPFDAFRINTAGKNTSFLDGIGVHSGTQEAAEDRFKQYWKGVNRDPSGFTMPLMIRDKTQLLKKSNLPYTESDLKKFLEGKAIGAGLKSPAESRDSQIAIRKALLNKYDTIPYVNKVEGGGGLSYITPDIKNIRSRFAAFDPARVNEPDLLAAGVPLGLLAGTNVEMPKKEKRK